MTSTHGKCQVIFYVDGGRDSGSKRAWYVEECVDEKAAQHLAIRTLLDNYMLLIYPRPESLPVDDRLYWCELVPGYYVDGKWQPVSALDRDAAFLNSLNGEITFSLAASMKRWQQLRMS